MSPSEFGAALRCVLADLATHEDWVLLQAGGEETLPVPVYRSEGCDGVAGAALGLALAGRRPLATLSPAAAALAALQRLLPEIAAAGWPPMAFRLPLEGDFPEPGQFALPGLRVAAPAAPADAGELLRRAVTGDGAWLYLEDRRLLPYREKAPHPATPRRGAICRQAGGDLTLIASGVMLVAAIRAVRPLLARGIEAEVIDLRLLAPLDLETLRGSLYRTHRALVIDEGATPLGPALVAAVTEAAFDELDAPVSLLRVSSGAATLAEALGRAVPAIVTQACWLLGRPAQLRSG